MMKNMDEMHDSTQHMDATTTHMDKTTSDMKDITQGMSNTTTHLDANTEIVKNVSQNMDKTTSHMDQTTSEVKTLSEGLYKLTAHLDATSSRLDANTEQVKNISNAMSGKVAGTLKATHTLFAEMRKDSAAKGRTEMLTTFNTTKDIGAKLSKASTYVDSMEYQHWDPSFESEKKRMTMMAEGLQQFYFDMGQYMKNRNDTDVSDLSTSVEFQNLETVAVAIDHVSLSQQEFLEGTPYKIYSPLDLMEEGLRKVKNKQPRNLALKQVANRAEDTIYLMRVRHNFLMALIYAQAYESKAGDLPGLLQKALSMAGRWTPVFADRNADQINELEGLVHQALRTRNFLKEMGVDVKTDKTIKGILARADFGSFNLTKMRNLGNIETADAIEGFEKAFNELIQ